MPYRLLLPVLAVTLLLSACGQDTSSEPTASPTAAAETNEAEATPSPSAPAAEPPAAPPRGGFGPRRATAPVAAITGVAECDRFLDRYRACLTRLPEEMRPGMETSLQAWEGSWKTMSADPATQGDLAAMCTRTADNAWAAVARFNCAR